MLSGYSSEIVTTIGLLMDIVGIWLLFKYGAAGGYWIDKPMPSVVSFHLDREDGEESLGGPALEVLRNMRTAKENASWGLSLATVGFIFQGIAQWLP